MAKVTINKVHKTFDKLEVVHGIDLDIAHNEFLVLVGPSGCGKSTTLRMVAGLEDITQGEIYIGERLVNDVPPKDRDIAMVFDPTHSAHDRVRKHELRAQAAQIFQS